MQRGIVNLDGGCPDSAAQDPASVVYAEFVALRRAGMSQVITRQLPLAATP